MEQEDYIKSLENLLIFICGTHTEWERILLELAKEKGNDAFFQLPVIQGTSNSVGISLISKLPFTQPNHGFADVYYEMQKRQIQTKEDSNVKMDNGEGEVNGSK